MAYFGSRIRGPEAPRELNVMALSVIGLPTGEHEIATAYERALRHLLAERRDVIERYRGLLDSLGRTARCRLRPATQ
jgi:hypothetical protein